MKKFCVLLLCTALVFALSTPVVADIFPPLEPGAEISMPSDIGFQIHDTCQGHDWFNQYHVREDGWFVTLHRVANLHSGDAQGFDRVYVDIYNAEGVFQKELSLHSIDANIVACITEETVEIHLPNCYLSYNMETEGVTCHYAPANHVQDSELYDLLWQSELQVGEWVYKSNGPFHMYHILMREKDGEVQTVLKLKGSSLAFPNIIPYIVCSAITILAAWWIVKKKRETRIPKDGPMD